MADDLGRRRAQLAAAVLSRVAASLADDGTDSGKVQHPPGKAAEFFQKAIAGGPPQLTSADVTSMITSIGLWERSRRQNIDDRIDAINSRANGSAARASEPASTGLSIEAANAYLGRRFAGVGLSATELVQLPGGKSKRTLLMTVVESSGDQRRMVLRQDFDVQMGGADVSLEFPLIADLHRRGLLVPEPLWLEVEKSELGNPFFAMQWIPGAPAGTILDIAAPASVAADLATFFGQLHAVPVTPDLQKSLRWSDEPAPVRAMLEYYLKIWRSCGVPDCVVTEAAFAWLFGKLDQVASAPAIVHGDSSFHNVFADGPRMTAMLDWEFAHCGDPAEDVMGCAHLVRRVMDWDEFLEIYIGAGGQEISTVRQQFFAILRSLRHAVNAARAATRFHAGEDGDIRIAAIAAHSREIFLRDVAEELAAAVSAEAAAG